MRSEITAIGKRLRREATERREHGRAGERSPEQQLDARTWLRQGKLPADTRTWLNRFPQVRELGLVVYSLEGLGFFLHEPQPRFGGLTAVELLEAGRADEVYAALAADHEGLGF